MSYQEQLEQLRAELRWSTTSKAEREAIAQQIAELTSFIAEGE